jgi:hypothetical protein
MPPLPRHRVKPCVHSSVVFACLLALMPGCDRVEGLFSGGAAEDEKAEAKGEGKGEGKGEAKTEAKAEAPAPAAAPAGAAPVEGTAVVEAAAIPEATAAPEAAPAAIAATPEGTGTGQSCIVGRWDAIEYTAAVRHAIAKDPQLRTMKKTSSGGHITYVVEPPTGTSGKVTATADHLKYGFSGKVEGFPVRVDLDIHGETEASYELPAPDRIVIGKPSRNTMKVKANAKVEGLGAARKVNKVDLDFDGSFVYDCSSTELKVWRGTRSGDAMVFARSGGK